MLRQATGTLPRADNTLLHTQKEDTIIDKEGVILLLGWDKDVRRPPPPLPMDGVLLGQAESFCGEHTDQALRGQDEASSSRRTA